MSPKIGRPIIGKKKDIDLKVRVDRETNEKLEQYAKENSITKAETARIAISRFLNKVK